MTEVSDYRAILQELGFRSMNPEPDQTPVFISYAFESPEQRLGDYLYYIENPDFKPLLTVEEKDRFKEALRLWGDACGIVFLETDGSADILVGRRDLSVGGYATTSVGGYFRDASSKLVAVNVPIYQSMVVLDDTSFRTMLHEIGHAIGLDHPHEGPFTLPAELDNTDNTVMSYQVVGETGLGPLDLAAVQAMYGTPDRDGALAESWSWDSTTDTLFATAKAGELFTGSGSNDVLVAPNSDVIVARFRERCLLAYVLRWRHAVQ